MTDKSLQLLLQQTDGSMSSSTLWLADEHTDSENIPPSSVQWKPLAISNRVSVCRRFERLGYTCHFSDFVFNHFHSGQFERIIYRISKERALVNYLINHSHRLLRPGGELLIAGSKNEGIKSTIEKTQALFASKAQLIKDKPHHLCARFIRNSESEESAVTRHLDDQNYATLRLINDENNFSFYSKPGIFGWEKIDKGSEFLIRETQTIFNQLDHRARVLDLGCGYGYLTLMAANLGFGQLTATDNNAAAVTACRYNCEQQELKADVIADDCASKLTEKFDLILCNPPFHQGFAIEDDLTGRFLKQTRRLMNANGQAFYVVNSFIPLEKKASVLFKHCRTIANNGSFKVVQIY